MTDTMLAGGKRASPLAFWLGAIAVTLGVLAHIPGFIECGITMNYQMAGMPMDPLMVGGMFLIVGGTIAAAYGLLPKPSDGSPEVVVANAARPVRAAPEGSMTVAHWQLLLVLMVALVIDIMKPATLGFVTPGTAKEYGLARSTVALLPFVALSGTTVGSFVWGFLADRIGRRASILLAAIMFIGTSICGAMPSFAWNLGMCFLMGMSAGGMLPIAFTLLSEIMPAKHRGWLLVLLGGISLIGGYLAASGLAALLEPHFGWRILWFVGLPTGLLLIALNRYVPESPRFLLVHGRIAEANAVMARFGARPGWAGLQPTGSDTPAGGALGLLRPPYLNTTLALNLTAIAWGLVNFGLVLWLPTDLRARGFSVANSNTLLAQSSLYALPTALLTAYLYQRWSSKWVLVLLSFVTAAALCGLATADGVIPATQECLTVLIAVLMIGANGVIAVLLPYCAESYPSYIRGRATGCTAGGSKLGGIGAQLVSMAGLIPPLATAALALAVPIAISALLVARFGAETRGRRLEDLDLAVRSDQDASLEPAE